VAIGAKVGLVRLPAGGERGTLARGLVLCPGLIVPPVRGGLHDLARPGLAWSSTTPRFTSTPSGLAVDVTSSGTAWTAPSSAANVNGAAAASIMCAFTPRSLQGTAPNIRNLFGWDPALGGVAQFFLRLGDSGLPGVLQFVCATGAGPTVAVATSTTTATAGRRYVLVGVYTGANLLLYVNGVLEATTAQTGAIATVGASVASLGVTDAGGRPMDGPIEAAAIWGRALTAAEVMTLARDPAIVHRPMRRVIRYVATGGGGATITATMATAAWTAASPTVVLNASASFLSIAGITVPVLEGQAVERIDWRGESYRAFAGNLRAMVRPDLLAWQVTTGLMTLTEGIALKAAVASGAHVACAGVGLPGTVTCEVTVGDGAYINTGSADGTGLLRSFVLTLRQVS
jgi:hypothetical protein